MTGVGKASWAEGMGPIEALGQGARLCSLVACSDAMKNVGVTLTGGKCKRCSSCDVLFIYKVHFLINMIGIDIASYHHQSCWYNYNNGHLLLP